MDETSSPSSTPGAAGFLSGGGEMGALMRAHDWSTSPLGSPEAWPLSLRTVVGLMLTSKFPMFVAWGPDLAFLYNDGYRPIFGAKHPHALGLPFARVWSEIWDDISPLVDRALAGEATFHENLHLVMERNGYPEDTWYTFSYSPVRDESGAVAGMYCACTETTEKVLSDRRMAFRLALDERLRDLADPRDVMSAVLEMLGRYLRADRAGYMEVDATGEWFTVEREWIDGHAPSFAGRHRLDDFGPPLARELKAGRVVILDDAFADARTAGDEVAASYAANGARAALSVPLVKGDRLTAALYVRQAEPRVWRDDEAALAREVAERTWNAVERVRAEAARRDAEEALKLQLAAENDRMRRLFQQAPGLIAVLRGPEHVFEIANTAYMQLVGHRDIIGKPIRDALPDIAGQGFFELLDEVFAKAQPFAGKDLSVRLQRTPGAPAEERFVDFIYQPIVGADGAVSGVFVEGYDVTDRVRGERHRELLLGELSHRVKNTLASVQSIATQTLLATTSPEAFREAFQSRLRALAQAHDLLSQNKWAGSALRDVAMAELGPHLGAGDRRISLEGADLRLEPRIALSLGMALHELATNAAKYGALSTPAGRVAVSWTVRGSDGGARLNLDWVESGGPPVEPPARRGFGSVLIERGLAHELDGEVQLAFEPDGVRCTMDIPLEREDATGLQP